MGKNTGGMKKRGKGYRKKRRALKSVIEFEDRKSRIFGRSSYKEIPEIDVFFEKKIAKKIFAEGKPEEQQPSRFGGPSFSHGKIEVMLQIYSKNQYETHPSVSRELNNNIY